MDMKLRKILRDFVNLQGKNNLLKDELTIDYELAETYLEEKEKAINFAHSCEKLKENEGKKFNDFVINKCIDKGNLTFQYKNNDHGLGSLYRLWRDTIK